MQVMEFRKIGYKDAVDFLLPKHYSGRIPSISFSFGWFLGSKLMAVCTFGKPASPPLCIGVCGKEFSDRVYELNRLCRVDELSRQISQFVSKCLKALKPKNLIIVSYSDTAMNHNGYIYQACNFIYTGASPKRTDKYTEGNKHCRHYDDSLQGEFRKVRSSKHRYIYFAMVDKQLRKQTLSALKYEQHPYPKGANSNYSLGDYLLPELIAKQLTKRMGG